jgi:hypothetical protein
LTVTPLRLSDRQLAEIRQAAQTVPWDLRPAYLERVAAELRGMDLAGADGLVHKIAYQVARSIIWTAGRTVVEI